MADNNTQISNTKQQIEEFLDMIIQYEEEASSEKEELDKLRERVINLEMENDQLQKEVGEGAPSYSFTELLNTKDRDI